MSDIQWSADRMDWENLRGDGKMTNICRSAIPGGWLVFVRLGGDCGGLSFVPDPGHRWNGKSIQVKP